MDKPRCPWPQNDPQMLAYHDTEWGVPVWDDRKLFEMVVLESAQAGLSWRIVLHKREGYRRLFAGFDPTLVAQMTEADVERLVLDPGIIRNRAKIAATITNARVFVEIAARHGSFAAWQWQFVGGQPVHNRWESFQQVPATTPLSDAMAKALKQAGMKFMGSTVVYAHLQACGVVNDHVVGCFRHGEVAVP